MSVTLTDLLALVGRLDDAPGFDTPRERFRRFLVEHVIDEHAAHGLIEECQRSVGEQHHRALQDMIVLVGRLLGFETSFGVYERLMDGAKIAGLWRSPGVLEVVLEVRTDQTTTPTLDSLARALAVVNATSRHDVESRIGLCVVARHYATRGRLEHAIEIQRQHQNELRIVSVRSLLSLAGQVSAGRVSHPDVVKLLKSGFALDFVIDLLDRPGPAAGAAPDRERDADDPVQHDTAQDDPEPSAPAAARRQPAFWVATIAANETAAPEQLLASVIARRRVLGICHAGPFQAEGAAGDWVCFFLAGKGIVGHAQLASVVDGKTNVVRNAAQFNRVYRLSNVELYEEPIVQALRAGRPFAVPAADVALAGPCLAPIAREDFIALTTYRDTAA